VWLGLELILTELEIANLADEEDNGGADDNGDGLLDAEVDFGGVQPPVTEGTASVPVVMAIMFEPQFAAWATRMLALSWS